MPMDTGVNMDGPRALHSHEFEALRRLTDIVFRPGMPEQYPQLFNTDNLDNLTVCFDGPTCTSHVGMVQRNALLMGCPIRVCCIGAVATHPDYRNLGLASACFDNAVRKAYSDGVDVMIVSGGRGLYTRNGCLHVGRDYRVKTDAEATELPNLCEVTIRPMRNEDLPLVAECYRREPVRFLRPPDDYVYFTQSGWAMNAPSEILTIHEAVTDCDNDSVVGSAQAAGSFLAYVILRKAEAGSTTSLVEFGGDRTAVLAALPEIMTRYGLAGLNWQVQGSDFVMKAICERSGLELAPTSASGTVKLINFSQLMSRMRPRFAELLGAAAADRLRFEQNGDEYIFALGDEQTVLDRDVATYAVFGGLAGLPDPLQSAPGLLGDALRAILPMPTLWYGINYV